MMNIQRCAYTQQTAEYSAVFLIPKTLSNQTQDVLNILHSQHSYSAFSAVQFAHAESALSSLSKQC